MKVSGARLENRDSESCEDWKAGGDEIQMIEDEVSSCPVKLRETIRWSHPVKKCSPPVSPTVLIGSWST